MHYFYRALFPAFDSSKSARINRIGRLSGSLEILGEADFLVFGANSNMYSGYVYNASGNVVRWFPKFSWRAIAYLFCSWLHGNGVCWVALAAVTCRYVEEPFLRKAHAARFN